MKKLFQRLSILIIISLYAVSALEVNAFCIKNTFFDEFDTYIESKGQKIESVVIKEKKKDNEKLQFEKQIFITTAQEYSQPFLISFTYPKPKYFVKSKVIWKRKLFVFYSSLLI